MSIEQPKLTQDQIHRYGISVFRQPADPADIHQIQGMLTEEFGPAVVSLTEAEINAAKMPVVYRGETARMVQAARTFREVSRDTVYEALHAGLHKKMEKPIVGKHIGLTVSPQHGKRPRLILARGNAEPGLRRDRTATTAAISEALGVDTDALPDWPRFKGLMPVARLVVADAAVLGRVRDFKPEAQVHYSGLRVHRIVRGKRSSGGAQG